MPSWKITDIPLPGGFITLGPPLSPQCQRNLEGIIHSCQSTGTPLEKDKCEGPSAISPFLGMELDSHKMEIRSPPPTPDKLELLRQLLKDWKGRKAGKKRERLPAACIQGSPSRSLIPTAPNPRRFISWTISFALTFQRDPTYNGGRFSQHGEMAPCALTEQTPKSQ